MINRVISLIVKMTATIGLVFLLVAALLIAIGRSPESFTFNFQAEILANYAYGLLVISCLVRLLDRSKD